MESNKKVVVFLLLIFFFELGWCLKLSSTTVPYYGILSREEILECHFDLENDTLYTLKWYKDGHEFFRFKPKDEPPIIVFPQPGVTVNENRSSLHHVHLQPITFHSQGDYRCEISADAPSFQTLYDEKVMKLMVLPQYGPKISGVYPWYNTGDNFRASCNVTKSYPAATLSWFVNDAQVDPEACQCTTSEVFTTGIIIDGTILYNSSSTLHFPIDVNYFRDGSISVECKASFPNSDVVLKDIVRANVKSGLGHQYADLLSGTTGNEKRMFWKLIYITIWLLLTSQCA